MNVVMFSFAMYLLVNTIIHYLVSLSTEVSWKRTVVIILLGLPAILCTLTVLVLREIKKTKVEKGES